MTGAQVGLEFSCISILPRIFQGFPSCWSTVCSELGTCLLTDTEIRVRSLASGRRILKTQPSLSALRTLPTPSFGASCQEAFKVLLEASLHFACPLWNKHLIRSEPPLMFLLGAPGVGFLVHLLLFFFVLQMMALRCRGTVMQWEVLKSREVRVDNCSYKDHAFKFPGPLPANLNVAAFVLSHKHGVLPLLMSFMLHQLMVFQYPCFIWS